MPLINFISHIQSGKYKELVERLREIYVQDNLNTVFDVQRRVIPRLSIAGNFKSDNFNLELISYSQFLFFEIQYLHPREYENVLAVLRTNPYVFAYFRNAIGYGICFIVKTDTAVENHRTVFRKAHRYFSSKLNTNRISKEGEDIHHLCLMSYDADAHINFAAIPMQYRKHIKF